MISPIDVIAQHLWVTLMSSLGLGVLVLLAFDIVVLEPRRHAWHEGTKMKLWGWFEDNEGSPNHDPPHDALCPYCFVPISEDDVRTHSIMMVGPHYAKRSYFYRTHRTCDDSNNGAVNMDGRIFDAIAKAGD